MQDNFTPNHKLFKLKEKDPLKIKVKLIDYIREVNIMSYINI